MKYQETVNTTDPSDDHLFKSTILFNLVRTNIYEQNGRVYLHHHSYHHYYIYNFKLTFFTLLLQMTAYSAKLL